MKHELIVTSLETDALVPKEKPSGMPTSDVIKITLIDPPNLIETGISKMFFYIVGIQYLYLPKCNNRCNISFNCVLTMFNVDKSLYLRNMALKVVLVTVQ